MKKMFFFVVMIAVMVLLTGCSKQEKIEAPDTEKTGINERVYLEKPNLILEDSNVEVEFGEVEISPEYIAEVEYNSQKNQW